jgi:chromosome segregation ATPase
MNELENDIKHWQEEAVTTKERLEEVEEVFEALQNRFKSEQGSLNSEREKCHKLERELNEVKENFNNLEKEKDRVKAVLSLQKQRSETTLVDESELKEEKLQLQLKLENLKLSMNEQIKEKELEFSKEKNVLTSQLNQSIAEKDKLNKDLQEAVSNYSRVEGQIIGFKESLRIAEENNKRLQMEKEKATSDLITIRKSLKEKEKVSTDEDSNQSSSNGTKKGSSPTFSAKLADAESRAEMATRLLQEIQSERYMIYDVSAYSCLFQLCTWQRFPESTIEQKMFTSTIPIPFL